MARGSRLVIPEYPQHVDQRAVRTLEIFSSEDLSAYLIFMAKEGIAIVSPIQLVSG
jgi:hypothetical protein